MVDHLYAAFLSLISILLLSVFWYKIAFKNPQSAPPLPPGPHGLPIVGYLPFLRSNLLHQFTELATQYGPIFKLRLGNKLCVVIDSPSLAKEVFRDQDPIFANRDVPIAAQLATFGGNDIAWSPSNSTWRSLRKLFVREMMSRSSLEASYNLRRDEVRKAIRNVYSKIGEPIEIEELIFEIELNVIMSMLWGGTMTWEEGERVGSEMRRLIPRLVDIIGTANVSDIFPVLAGFDIQRVKKKMERVMKSLESIFDAVIAKHKKKMCGHGNEEEEEEGREDFLQILLERNEKLPDSDISVTETQIKAIMTDILVGGTDTTSMTIQWVMAELMNSPEALKKVQNELSIVVGLDNIVEEHHIPKLQYLLAVLKETMRLHPAVSLLLPRSPSKSTVIGGYTVPYDTRVLINAWSIQRNPLIWDNPIEFKPERFLTEISKFDFGGNNFTFFPFGSGRRVCAGLPLAERMLIYLLASLLHSFEWKLPEGEKVDMEEVFGIVLRKRVPLVAIPNPRISNSNLY